jgi:hypothetical protein
MTKRNNNLLLVAGLLCLLLTLPALAQQRADSVLVDKSERRPYLLKDGQVLAAYRATFGADPKGVWCKYSNEPYDVVING